MKAPCRSLATAFALASTQLLHSAEVDASFEANVHGTVHSILVDPAGNILAGGEFFAVNGLSVRHLARFTRNGEADATFKSQRLDGAVFAMALAAEGQLWVAGAFTSPTANLARLLPNGEPDGEFAMNGAMSGRAHCVTLTGEGGALFGGNFRRINGSTANYVGRASIDGKMNALSTDLLPSMAIEAGVNAIAIESGGKILAGGIVNTVQGHRSLVRLNADGSLDSTFPIEHGPILYAKEIVPLADGRILVAGVADSSGSGFVRRLNADGTMDNSFAEARFEGAVEAIALDNAGAVLVGGSFPGKTARLTANGALDATWNVTADRVVRAICVQDDGRILIGGAFTEVNGLARHGLARLVDKGARQQFTATSANGRFVAKVVAQPGRSYRVEASTDLVTWTYVETSAAAEGVIEISDPAVSSRHRCFYRLAAVEPAAGH